MDAYSRRLFLVGVFLQDFFLPLAIVIARVKYMAGQLFLSATPRKLLGYSTFLLYLRVHFSSLWYNAAIKSCLAMPVK